MGNTSAPYTGNPTKVANKDLLKLINTSLDLYNGSRKIDGAENSSRQPNVESADSYAQAEVNLVSNAQMTHMVNEVDKGGTISNMASFQLSIKIALVWWVINLQNLSLNHSYNLLRIVHSSKLGWP